MDHSDCLDKSPHTCDIPAAMDVRIDISRQRFPFCIVWTPIPILTYLFPFIGHMGIATSTGVIRDFAGPYHVSEDKMAFGKPTKYWQLDYTLVKRGAAGWDDAVAEHNLCCDNCHSHVAAALNLMNFKNSSSWNMVKLAFFMLIYGKYISLLGFLRTWLPFLTLLAIIVLYCSFQ